MSKTDMELLARYAKHRAEDAFAEIVRRHVALVYSAALRQVRSPQLAEEVTQSAFIDLARNAARLKPDSILTAWLYQVTRRTAIDVVRREASRQLREQIATDLDSMNAATADWTHIEPVLDEAMQSLDETDRAALLLRFFENKSLREVGATLGTSENAAQKRLSRAVERLREFFKKRGVTVGASGLVAVISANAVQAAPVGLAAAISTAVALAGTTIAGTATAVSKAIAMTTLQKTLAGAALIIALGAGIYETRLASTLGSQVKTLQEENARQIQQLKEARDEAVSRLKAAEEEASRRRQDAAELLKLRAEVTQLRMGAQRAAQQKPSNSGSPVESIAKTWVDRVVRLKQRLEQTPQAGIPELQLLDEEDWLAVVKGHALDTDVDYRRALSALRNAGEGKFTALMQKALLGFKRSNQGRFPMEVAELQPYFDARVDAAIFDRWKIAPGETVPNVGVGEVIITQRSPPIDDVFDMRQVVGIDGGHGATDFLPPAHWAELKAVSEAYRAAHNGQTTTDFTELQAYATTAEQQAALQKMLLRGSVSK